MIALSVILVGKATISWRKDLLYYGTSTLDTLMISDKYMRSHGLINSMPLYSDRSSVLVSEKKSHLQARIFFPI